MKKSLFEALNAIDDKILSESAKQKIRDEFDTSLNEAIEKEKEKLVETMEEYIDVASKSAVMSEKEKFDSAVSNKVNESVENVKETLIEEYDTKLDESLENITEKLDKYVDHEVAKFVEENKSTWEQEVTSTKADAILETTAKFMNDFGISLDEVTSDDEAKAKLDETLTENSKLKEEILEMTKEKAITEACENMTAIDRDKVSTLMESVKYEDAEQYASKIDLIKKTLTPSQKVDESKEVSKKKRSW